MKQIKLPLLFAAFFMLNFPVQGQSLEQLNSVNKKYQTCLDKGTYMLACSQEYYTKMDKLLNLAYNHIQSSVHPSRRAAFTEEQVKWLAKRDAYFIKINNEYPAETGNGFTGNDKRMIAVDKKAQFVRKRVGELIKRWEEFTVGLPLKAATAQDIAGASTTLFAFFKSAIREIDFTRGFKLKDNGDL